MNADDWKPTERAEKKVPSMAFVQRTAKLDSVVPVVNAQSLEAGLVALGRTVESHYYPEHGHGILFDTPQHADAVARTTAFLREQLGE